MDSKLTIKERSQQLKDSIKKMIAEKHALARGKQLEPLADGVHEVRDKEDILRERLTIKNGKKNGLCQYFSRRGDITYAECYVDGVKHGPALFYNHDGKIDSKFTFVQGEIAGECEFYRREKIISQINFEHGKPNGPIQVYDIAGNLILKGMMVNGKKEGLAKVFDRLGYLSATIEYQRNMRNGYTKSFDAAGNLLKISFYVDDLLEGDSIEYDENGAVKSVDKYQHGKLVASSKK